MAGYDEEQLGVGGDELSLVHPDPVVLELNRMHNLLKGPSLLLPLSHFFQTIFASSVNWTGFSYMILNAIYGVEFQ